MEIYKPSEKDIEKESKMLRVLKQCQLVSNPIQKRSGDLHVWIYLKEKQAGNCINVVVSFRTINIISQHPTILNNVRYNTWNIKPTYIGPTIMYEYYSTQ